MNHASLHGLLGCAVVIRYARTVHGQDQPRTVSGTLVRYGMKRVSIESKHGNITKIPIVDIMEIRDSTEMRNLKVGILGSGGVGE